MRIRWRGLELPNQVTCEKSEGATYAKFVAEPFEHGFGVTIGNSLRRIMLSSLEGSAVTQIKIQGVSHEFMTISGVYEDVTEIVLNVKSLIVKSMSDQPRTLRIEKHSKGVITGADIITDDMVEIINKEHVIATLTGDVSFVMEMVVEKGRGYVPVAERKTQNQEIGVIPVDAAFSPVVRVRYAIEETRVGQKTNYDKLIFEIWTDGSLAPEMALVESAKILRKHLNPFVQYAELGAQIHSEVKNARSDGLPPEVELKLQRSIADLHLSVRATNCLEAEHIMTVRELVSRSEESLLDVRNFGDTTLKEVREKLAEMGLQLGMRLPPAYPSPFQ